MKTRHLIFFCLSALLLGPFSFPGQVAAQDPEVAKLETAFAEALSRLEQPMSELDTKYQENLDKWMAAAQSRGDLEALVAGKKERETFKQLAERKFDAWPDLKRLREIYETTHQKLSEGVADDRRRLFEAFHRELISNVERLTRAGQLDEAVRLSQRAQQMEKLLAVEAVKTPLLGGEGKDEEVLWEFKSLASVDTIKECGLKKVGDAYVIVSPRGGAGSYHNSRRTFKPPFRIEARVTTDSTNIRFYYNNNTLSIFNWEMNPRELRVHEPKTNRNMGFRDKGELERNTLHDIEIDVLDDEIKVKADRKRLVEVPADNKGLDGPVGIGPAFGSTLTLESMRVIQLK